MDQETTACNQLTGDGRLRHLLDLLGLDRSLITNGPAVRMAILAAISRGTYRS